MLALFRENQMKGINLKPLYFIILALFYFSWNIHNLQTKEPDDYSALLFIVDASGSMGERFDDSSRLESAKMLIQEQLAVLDSSVSVGLLGYGNGLEGCDSVRLYSAVQKANRFEIAGIVSSFRAYGVTPLASALNYTRDKVLSENPGLKIVIISDGAESCGGDPIKEAAKLKKMGAQVYIIGLSVDLEAKRQLQNIANTSGGQFTNVQTFDDFARALKKAAKFSLNNQFKNNTEKWDSKNDLYVFPDAKNVDDILKNQSNPISSNQNQGGLIITSAERKGDNIIIDYMFKSQEKGDYFINFYAMDKANIRSDRGLTSGDRTLFGNIGLSYFNVFSGKGRTEMEINEKILPGAPIYIVGELWKTDEVPFQANISNTIIVK